MDVVCGIIRKGDRFLIAKRGKGTDEGVWEFPGGKVEAQETKEMAVIRELLEELQVHVKILKYLTCVEDHHAEEPIHVYAFLCEILSGEPSLSVHTESRWVWAEELYAYGFQKADTPILDLLQTMNI